MRWYLRVLAGLLAFFGVVLSARADDETAYSYRYFKQTIPLTLDPSRVAILQAPQQAESTRARGLPDLGIDAPNVSAWPVPGWSFVKTPADAADAPAAAALVARLAADDRTQFVSPVFTGPGGGWTVFTQDIEIGFSHDLSAEQCERILADFNVGDIRERQWARMKNVYLVRTSEKNALSVLLRANALAQHADVRFCNPSIFVEGSLDAITLPNDQYWDDLWGLHNVGQVSGYVPNIDVDGPSAWQVTKGDPDTAVVVMDVGVQLDHPDLSVGQGYDFTLEPSFNGGPVHAEDNHGTAVAGCIAARINNSIGVVGVCPECTVHTARMAISLGGSSILTLSSWMVNALAWAEGTGARITNTSLSLPESSAIEQVFSDTRARGMLHFASSGNTASGGLAEVAFPARLPSVLAVGAIDPLGERATFSNYGSDLDFVAPGYRIHSTDRTGTAGYAPGDYVNYLDGTSFASPYAAGVAALMLSVNPFMRADDVEQAFEDTARRLRDYPSSTGWHQEVGWGLVNANRAARRSAEMLQATTRVSVSSSGAEGNGDAGVYLNGPAYYEFAPSLSANGRFVAFVSAASNLVPGDTNSAHDAFVHDRQTGQTTRVSVSSGGAQGGFNILEAASISADGRFVAFVSYSPNLVPGDTNSEQDAFVHDRQTGQTTRVSISSAGAQGNGDVLDSPSISADGRFVAFESWASNLVAGDTNERLDVFVHDRQTGATTRVSVSSAGAQATDGSFGAKSISADGRFVAFVSRASNLVPGDTNSAQDAFVHDRQTGQTTRVSISSAGAQGNGDVDSYGSLSISADGRFVAFVSGASNLVPGDTNSAFDVFVHDRQNGQTTRVSVSSAGAQATYGSGYYASISADGRFVAFVSYAPNLVPGDTNGFDDVFVHDRQTGQTMRVSVSAAGEQGVYGGHLPSISADGRFVAFVSAASNLVPGDTNGRRDVFVHDRLAFNFGSTSGGFCEGDANGDFVTDFLDLNIVLSDYGLTAQPGALSGDLNFDGVCDFIDLNIVLSAYGTAC